MTTNYIALHVITTIDASGYVARRIAESREHARTMIQELEETGIYKWIRYSKEILTGKKLAMWETYLAEK